MAEGLLFCPADAGRSETEANQAFSRVNFNATSDRICSLGEKRMVLFWVISGSFLNVERLNCQGSFMPEIRFEDPQTISRISSPSSPVELGTEPHQTHLLKMQTSIQYLVPNSRRIYSLSRPFQPLLHQTVHVNARLELNRPRPIPPCLSSQLKPQQT